MTRTGVTADPGARTDSASDLRNALRKFRCPEAVPTPEPMSQRHRRWSGYSRENEIKL